VSYSFALIDLDAIQPRVYGVPADGRLTIDWPDELPASLIDLEDGDDSYTEDEDDEQADNTSPY